MRFSRDVFLLFAAQNVIGCSSSKVSECVYRKGNRPVRFADVGGSRKFAQTRAVRFLDRSITLFLEINSVKDFDAGRVDLTLRSSTWSIAASPRASSDPRDGLLAQKETLHDRHIPRYRQINVRSFPTFSDISDHLDGDEMTFTRNERPDTELSNVDCAPSIRAKTIPNAQCGGSITLAKKKKRQIKPNPLYRKVRHRSPKSAPSTPSDSSKRSSIDRDSIAAERAAKFRKRRMKGKEKRKKKRNIKETREWEGGGGGITNNKAHAMRTNV